MFRAMVYYKVKAKLHSPKTCCNAGMAIKGWCQSGHKAQCTVHMIRAPPAARPVSVATNVRLPMFWCCVCKNGDIPVKMELDRNSFTRGENDSVTVKVELQVQ